MRTAASSAPVRLLDEPETGLDSGVAKARDAVMRSTAPPPLCALPANDGGSAAMGTGPPSAHRGTPTTTVGSADVRRTPSNAKPDRVKLPKDEKKARDSRRWMCANFYDVRAFGAVMSTSGANCGQVRGPAQFTFSRSIEPILPQEISLTRMAATTEKDADAKGDIRTMGRKHIVPYGLYRAHGYIPPASPATTRRAPDSRKRTWSCSGPRWSKCSTTTDRRRAARWRRGASSCSGTTARSAPPRRTNCSKGSRSSGCSRARNTNPARAPTICPPARAYGDYKVAVDDADLPKVVEIVDRI